MNRPVAWHFVLSQSRFSPPRYREPSRFEIIPSHPSLAIYSKRRSPSPITCPTCRTREQAAALVVVWNAAIYFDSSALTAGTVQAADKELRGTTMGLHSMCGYAGGFIGPLGVGLVLDWAGNADGWGLPSRPDHTHGPVCPAPPRCTNCRTNCGGQLSLVSEVTGARCSGAAKRSPRHPLGKQVHRCRSSPPRRRAAESRRIGRA